MKVPLINIAIITYNHEAFIATCIERVLAQHVNFDYTINIYDDCSTDETGAICKQWAAQYPGLIQYIRHENNIGISANWAFAINNSQAKYFAICEGDDYWIDRNKLQKQIDFLEANPDCSICFHDMLEHNRSKPTLPINSLPYVIGSSKRDIDDLANGNFIMTVTAVFKNHLSGKLPEWYAHTPAQDYAFFMLTAKYGRIGYIPQQMVAYRNDGGAWTTLNESGKIMVFIKCVAKLQGEFVDMPIIRARILGFLLRHHQMILDTGSTESQPYVDQCMTALVDVFQPLLSEYHTMKLQQQNPSVKKLAGNLVETVIHRIKR